MLEIVTDRALSHLGEESLLKELLDRVRELLAVDTTAVLLLDPSASHLVATAARGLEEEVTRGVRIPLGKGFAGRIAAEKRPVVLDEVDHSNVLNPILREKGLHSLLGVPLLVGGRVLGVLHVGTLTRRRFTDDDVELLRLVADRVALSMQAQRARTDRDAAVALQRSLLPADLPAMSGIEFASRYVAGDSGAVGGDWYDAFLLPGGHLWFVIGDVLGRGLNAAATMGRIRSALRAYALEFDDPATVLTKLDRKVQQFEPGSMATVLCGVLGPGGRVARLSSAGHPPPVLARPGAPAHLVELPPDLPVGVELGHPRTVTELELPDGALLCLYTDGLVERRRESVDVGLGRLRAAVTAEHPEQVCVNVMAALIGAEPPGDDIAVLMLRMVAGRADHRTWPAPPGRPDGGLRASRDV
jgi:putative methionine-R-sulfoxide reductase with GAF domain